jgi:hypothetical protein
MYNQYLKIKEDKNAEQTGKRKAETINEWNC